MSRQDIKDEILFEAGYIAKNRIKKVIKRLENYPTDLSCYVTFDEAVAATNIKKRFIEILKEELL